LERINPLLENNLFYILTLFLIVGSISVISFREPLYNVVGFLLSMLAIAGLFALLHQSFLFFAQLIVSVGAVVTLTLIIIATLNITKEEYPKEPSKNTLIVISSILTLPIMILIYKAIEKANLKFPPIKEDFGSLFNIGKELFANYVYAFELISILLLVALVGAVVITQKKSLS
jgi:NADH-quinone oxidoreductase subunit J